MQVLRPLVYKEDSGSVGKGGSVLIFLRIRKKKNLKKTNLCFYPKWKHIAFSWYKKIKISEQMIAL
jgi:hypothetical protein